MACRPYLRKKALAQGTDNLPEFAKKVHDSAYQDSVSCSLEFLEQCKDHCTSTTKNTLTCTTCLSNVHLCARSPTPDSKEPDLHPCCPFAAEAFECNRCLNRTGNDLKQCLHKSMPKHAKNGIIAGSVIGAIVFIVFVAYTVYRWRRREDNAAGLSHKAQTPQQQQAIQTAIQQGADEETLAKLRDSVPNQSGH